ncbi:MAG: carboxypeptidase-like regulatory domain-containing protein, partial [Solirubrobacteraceae bacterium]
VIVDAVIAATSPETLSAAGYVRRRDSSSVIFDMPSAEVLLSDDFAAHHCFGLAKPPDEHPEWIGVRFTPRDKRGDISDVRGVLWLDRARAELKRLEFTYANLPRATYEVCDDAPEHIPVADRKRMCGPVPDNDANRLGLGGEADFQRLATGEWMVTHWALRKPPDEGKYRKTVRCQPQRRTCDPCYTGPRCQDVWWMWPRLVTTSATISRVTRAGREVYRDDSTLALIAAIADKRAGSRPARLEGRITNEDGGPLAAAVIQTDDPARAGIADSAGVFRIAPLPPGSIGVLVRCRGYEPVRFRLPLLADSTRHLALSLVPDPRATRSASDCSGVP